ncbi:MULTISPECIES: hypothetical protein [Halococcus]|uniref:DUF8142 domain-containing protein n=1 Tax=Halococcus salifodinae DSM 8989 TaxID=1227456 RepID=M0N2Z9_9EURY|nr:MULTISPECIES: hypothetical protein [Halococcus]EMA51055.1 hypothetical protein C450_13010 [Halococcus salifodinae DSM 8989]
MAESPGEPAMSRKRAALAVLPFLLIGLTGLVFVLRSGLDLVWGLAILPPILFTCVLAWIAFRSGFADR